MVEKISKLQILLLLFSCDLLYAPNPFNVVLFNRDVLTFDMTLTFVKVLEYVIIPHTTNFTVK